MSNESLANVVPRSGTGCTTPTVLLPYDQSVCIAVRARLRPSQSERFQTTSCSVDLLCSVLLFAASLRAADERPNIILIMADNLGYECLSSNGSLDYRSPHLDALGAQGIRLKDRRFDSEQQS